MTTELIFIATTLRPSHFFVVTRVFEYDNRGSTSAGTTTALLLIAPSIIS